MLMLEKKTLKLKNGETIAYVEHGKGKNLLFLIHGNMSSGLHYLPLIEKLPEDFRIIAPDMRGFGDSSYEKRFDSLYELTEDLFQFATALKMKDFTMVGWSTGGGVSLRFAAVHPELVKKVILIESMSYKGYPIFTKDAMGKPVLGQIYKNKEDLGKDPIQVAPAAVAMATKNFAWMSWLWDAVMYPVNKPTPEQNKIFIDETLKQRNLVDIDWGIAEFNMGEGNNLYADGDKSIHLVKCPVLSISSKKDYVVLEYMVKETVVALGDKAKLIVYENGGHSPLIDNLAQLTEDVVKFAR